MAVELDSLTKYFGQAAALHRLTLTVANGTRVCLLGPSGCGKTPDVSGRLVSGFLKIGRFEHRGEHLATGDSVPVIGPSCQPWGPRLRRLRA
jgi:ABC-type Fe3+/spermidine/putrescine transport system ATPase subunit